jgi:polyphosphate glucokinase
MDGPVTLAIDIGGTGLKAGALDAEGNMLLDRVRTKTEYPCPPDALIAALRKLVTPLPAFDRISAGFPGVVRKGRILSAPHFVTVDGPGSHVDLELVKAWDHFDLAGALEHAWQRPARVLNDADLQGLDVISGRGVELVVTLGTGVGTALFEDGRLGPHLELAHHRFRKGETYNEQLGAAARKRIGNKRWNGRLVKAIDNLRMLTLFDHLYLGGGNAEHADLPFPDDITVVDANAGVLGGLKLWTTNTEGP